MKRELPQLVEIYIALLTHLKTSTAQEAQQEGRIIYHWILGICHEKAQKAQRRKQLKWFLLCFLCLLVANDKWKRNRPTYPALSLS